VAEEGRIGGHYIVDIELHTDFSKAAAQDTLSDTIDYVDVNRIVSEEMAICSKLIEHVGQRIVNRIKSELNGILAGVGKGQTTQFGGEESGWPATDKTKYGVNRRFVIEIPNFSFDKSRS
jgi:hypothetical protein